MPNALEHLLDRTHAAVLSGNLAELSVIGPEVEAIVLAMPQLDRATAARLRQKAERNASLLQAAGRGVRAAQTRLREIMAGPTLTTYDARGQKAAIATPSMLAPHRF